MLPEHALRLWKLNEVQFMRDRLEIGWRTITLIAHEEIMLYLQKLAFGWTRKACKTHRLTNASHIINKNTLLTAIKACRHRKHAKMKNCVSRAETDKLIWRIANQKNFIAFLLRQYENGQRKLFKLFFFSWSVHAFFVSLNATSN